MKEPLKVGDRVAVYSVDDGRRIGVVREVHDAEMIGVAWNHPGAGKILGIYHLKQCRRLKRKERRRVWVWDQDVAEGNHVLTARWQRNPDENRWVEFIEVKKK